VYNAQGSTVGVPSSGQYSGQPTMTVGQRDRQF